MNGWVIRRIDDHRIIGTVATFSAANEIARVLTANGIVVEVQNAVAQQQRGEC